MGTFADSIVAASRRARTYAERVLKDIRPDQFARKPTPGGVTVDCNHPAFVYGHLSLYPARIAGILGKDAAAVAVPAGYEELFKNGTPCHDDPNGTIYPPMAEIVQNFFRAYDGILAIAATIPDEAFGRENPDARYREYFPTVGQAAVFLLNNHNMMHLGQVSTWRRCMGLGAA